MQSRRPSSRRWQTSARRRTLLSFGTSSPSRTPSALCCRRCATASSTPARSCTTASSTPSAPKSTLLASSHLPPCLTVSGAPYCYLLNGDIFTCTTKTYSRVCVNFHLLTRVGTPLLKTSDSLKRTRAGRCSQGKTGQITRRDLSGRHASEMNMRVDWQCWCRSLNLKETLENDPEAYYNKDELVEPLLIMYNSLIETQDDSIANGRLLDVIRQVSEPALRK